MAERTVDRVAPKGPQAVPRGRNLHVHRSGPTANVEFSRFSLQLVKYLGGNDEMEILGTRSGWNPDNDNGFVRYWM